MSTLKRPTMQGKNQPMINDKKTSKPIDRKRGTARQKGGLRKCRTN